MEAGFLYFRNRLSDVDRHLIGLTRFEANHFSGGVGIASDNDDDVKDFRKLRFKARLSRSICVFSDRRNCRVRAGSGGIKTHRSARNRIVIGVKNFYNSLAGLVLMTSRGGKSHRKQNQQQRAGSCKACEKLAHSYAVFKSRKGPVFVAK